MPAQRLRPRGAPTTPAERFGENVRRFRHRVDLSQEELAFRSGLHRTEIGFLENGKRSPGIDTVVKLMGALEVSANDLLTGIEWVPNPDSIGGHLHIRWADGSTRIVVRRSPDS